MWPIIQWWMHYHHNLPENMEMLRLEAFPKAKKTLYTEVEAAEIVPLFNRGPRKGRKNYAKATGRHVIQILDSDFPIVLATYEAVTGMCRECYGEKQRWIGWGVETGHRYEPCDRCKSTGIAPKDTVTSAT